MTKDELTQATDACIETTREALQTVWDAINKGQQKKLYKLPEVREMLERFGVEVEE